MTSETLPSRVRRLWWLHPTWLFGAVIGGTMLAAYLQTDAAFSLYGTPKYITAEHVALAAAAILVFALGQQFAEATGRVPEETSREIHSLVSCWFWLTTGLTLLGYLVWLFVGVRNGFSLATVAELINADEPGQSDQIRTEMFATIKGITTCTQFGVAAVPLGLWLLFVQGQRHVVWPIGLLVALAAGRALVLSERLALIELVLIGVVVVLRTCALGRRFPPLGRLGLQFAPLVGVAALLLVFGGFEYFRSWRFYRQDFDSLASFTVWRVSGYYTTAHNNGAMALTTQRSYPLPYATIRQLWSIPGLNSTPFGYTEMTGVDPVQQHALMLERYGTPELNNEGGVFQPALDFGTGGYLLFWFGAGFVGGRLYRHYLVGTLPGLTIYPLVLVAILETPRLLYLSSTRSFPALVALSVLAWQAQRMPRAVPAPAQEPVKV